MHVMCRRVECSILILDTIFDNKYHGNFHMEFQQNPYGLIPWNPDGLIPWNPDGLVPWNPCGIELDSIWN